MLGTKLLKLFDELIKTIFDSIPSQLINKPEYRIRLNKTIADCLQITMSEREFKHLYDLAHLQITSNLE
jgi:hypothetical protein